MPHNRHNLQNPNRGGELSPTEVRPPGLLGAIFAPVDIAFLVYFRIVFGAILFWEVVRYFQNGWIERYYIEPVFFFKYYGFEWVRPWSGDGMYVHFLALGLLAIFIMCGFLYRLAAALFFLGFTYVFLLDQANYLNHFYLVSLVSFLLIFLPANRDYSVDSWWRPQLRRRTAPAWTLWLLRFQLGLPYVYGGFAKLNADWLQGEPMRMWLAKRMDFPVIGRFFGEEWMVYAFSYGGLLFDLLIVPLLLFKPTRWVAICWLVAFHLINSQLFQIGIFPWFMLLATPVFLPPQWLSALVRRPCPHCGLRAASVEAPPATNPASLANKLTLCAITGFVAFQLLFPFRHYVYPGNVSWTEEGHRFSWHMKLRSKRARAEFYVYSLATGNHWRVAPDGYLTKRQHRKMRTRPDMILQFANFLKEEWLSLGYEEVSVYADVRASLNGRAYQQLIDPSIDLSRQGRTLRPSDWVFQLHASSVLSRMSPH